MTKDIVEIGLHPARNRYLIGQLNTSVKGVGIERVNLKRDGANILKIDLGRDSATVEALDQLPGR